MDFTAIDFETANSSRGSACSVGVVVVKQGQIVHSLHQLLRPDPFEFSGFNISIHGITPEIVEDAPSFAQYWPTLREQIAGPLVAHNAAFDMSVLRRSLDAVDMAYPDTDYFCTMVLAKTVWPGQPSYRLSHMAKLLNLEFTHHNALEDARACAHLAQAACQRLGAKRIMELPQHCGVCAGHLYEDGYIPCTCNTETAAPRQSRAAGKLRPSDIAPSTTAIIDAAHPFYGKGFVFTGEMSSMPRAAACQLVVDHGGICHDNVKKRTDYLVMGQNAFAAYAAGYKSGKTDKAEELIQTGQTLEIIPEEYFLQML